MNKNMAAGTPPMGWNSFDYYDTTVNEAAVRANAEYMAEHLKQFGWEYIVVDIQWYAYDTGSQRKEYEYIPFSRVEMDEYGRLIPCRDKFPSSADGRGFAPLAEYIHSLGLKFGIHIMRGIPRKAAEMRCRVMGTEATADQVADAYSICQWNPDMYGVKDIPAGQSYYDSLLELYASWGVDFIKCDDICSTYRVPDGPVVGLSEIKMLYRAIQKTGRPIVLSLSPGPAHLDYGYQYMKYANMWRLTNDFWDEWPQLRSMFDYCEKWQFHVRKGSYPDCDMLPLGWIGKGFDRERQTQFTYEEQQTMMTLWCLMHSPLMVGAELTRLDDQTYALLTNRELLRMLEMDCKAVQVSKDDEGAIWLSRNEKDQSLYIALFNFGEERVMSVSEEEIAMWLDGRGLARYREMYNVWDGRKQQLGEKRIVDSVKSHGVSLWVLRSH